MAFARIKTPCERGGKFTDKAVVVDAEVSEFQSEADKVRDAGVIS